MKKKLVTLFCWWHPWWDGQRMFQLPDPSPVQTAHVSSWHRKMRLGRMWRTACLYLLGTVCFLGSLKQEVLGPEAVRLPSELCLILLWRTWLLPIAHSLNPSSQQLAAPSELRPVECLRAQSLHVCQCSADCLQLCKLTWLSGEEQAFASLPSYLNSNQVTCSLSQLFSFCWAPDLAEALREVTFSQHCSCSTR